MQDARARAQGLTADNAGARRGAGRTLAGACIGMFLNVSPLILLSFGVFMLPIVKSTGWDRTVIASSIGSAMVLTGLSSPISGWLINHFGPRRFVTIGFPLCGLGIMLLGTPNSALMFVLTVALVGALASGQTSIPYIYCVSSWFDQRRGMALGLILACTGLGLAVIPPVAAQLIARFGWRGAYVSLGAVVLVAGLAVGRFLIVDPPVITAASRAEVPGVPWRRALSMRSFWCLAGSILLVGGAAAGGMLNLNVLLVERGVSPQRAAFVMSIVGLSTIVSRLAFGALFDRVRSQWLTALICLSVGAAFLVLATTTGPLGVMVAAVLLGAGFGAEGDALSYMTSRAFGMRDFGTIFGVIFLAFTCGGAIGPVVFAQLGKRSPDHHMVLWLAAGACGLATILVMQIREADLPYARYVRAPRDDKAIGRPEPLSVKA